MLELKGLTSRSHETGNYSCQIRVYSILFFFPFIDLGAKRYVFRVPKCENYKKVEDGANRSLRSQCGYGNLLLPGGGKLLCALVVAS